MHEAAKHGHTDEALYLDSILDSAAQGAVSLLKELPREHLGSLRLMLNQAVPCRARLDIWRLLLKQTAVSACARKVPVLGLLSGIPAAAHAVRVALEVARAC